LGSTCRHFQRVLRTSLFRTTKRPSELPAMGKSKMDDAAAARIRKARGDRAVSPRKDDQPRYEQDEFAKRAAMAAQANKDRESSNREQQGAQSSGGSKHEGGRQK
ncbi:hypothetical protein CI238_07462, partial [Colletotrichum incanum]